MRRVFYHNIGESGGTFRACPKYSSKQPISLPEKKPGQHSEREAENVDNKTSSNPIAEPRHKARGLLPREDRPKIPDGENGPDG
jgi:hypothetical protein